jgi:hypothetical protein
MTALRGRVGRAAVLVCWLLGGAAAQAQFIVPQIPRPVQPNTPSPAPAAAQLARASR